MERTRQHIAQYLLNGDIDDHAANCCQCGVKCCSVSIEVSSGRGKKANLVHKSLDCKNYNHFSLAAAGKRSKSNPSTNRPVSCKICKLVLWSYNMRIHII